MYRFATDGSTDVPDLQERLRKMNDAELLRFGQAARFMCSRQANMRKPPSIPTAECDAGERESRGISIISEPIGQDNRTSGGRGLDCAPLLFHTGDDEPEDPAEELHTKTVEDLEADDLTAVIEAGELEEIDLTAAVRSTS
jgi:hypothetical protein